MTNQKFDDKKAEAFGDRLMEMLNLGSLALMTTIGYRTGLGTMWGRENSPSKCLLKPAS